ncbi:MAG: hypothetical protein RJA63_3368 [Pseudomonadota bacterium]|jgi:hypothetical protein
MKNLLWMGVGTFALVASLNAPAAELISFGGASYHFERDLGHNEFNYGLGYERDINADLSVSAGVYKNSLRRASFYLLGNYYLFAPGSGFRLGATGGLMSGYHRAAVIPVLMPTIEWRGERLAVQAFAVPTVKPYVDGALVVQLKYQYGK